MTPASDSREALAPGPERRAAGRGAAGEGAGRAAGSAIAGTSTPTGAAWIWGIVGLSLLLNVWGIGFGLPDSWHPDELVSTAVRMARNFTLNPHAYLYGSMHYYVVLSVIIPTDLIARLFGLPEDLQKTLVYLAARVLTALFGAGCVILTYRLADRLFERTTALLSALLLTLSVGLVSLGHFATVDVPLLFWMMASYVMSAGVLQCPRSRGYLLAGAFAGAAAGTKYVGGSAILALLAAHVLSQGRAQAKHLLLGIGAAAIVFMIVDLPMVFASCEFLEGFIKDNAYNTTIGSSGSGLFNLRLPAAISDATNVVVAALFVPAVLYPIVRLVQRAEVRRTLFLMVTVVPFYLLISNVHYATTRHILPIIPPLLILVAKLLVDLRGDSAADWRRRALGHGLMALTVAVSALYTLGTELQFTFDGRNLATAWVMKEAAPGARIEVTRYGPRLSIDRFVVQRRPFLRNIKHDIAGIQRASLYQTLQPVFLDYKAFAERSGLCEVRPRYYAGWYELADAQATDALKAFDPSVAGLEWRGPDLLIISSLYYDRFASDPTGPDGHFFADLFAGETSFRQVAEFHYEFLPWLEPEVEFMNPTIRIFRRAGDAGPGGATPQHVRRPAPARSRG